MSAKVIIIKRKKNAPHAHHGGSWKVAYADFVTAMMAFFLVMWIMGMDQGVRDLVQGYFENPVGFKRTFSGGKNLLSQGNSITNLEIYRNVILKRRQEETERFEETARHIEEQLKGSNLAKGLDGALELTVTDQGLRIEMMETGQGRTFFDVASASPTPALRYVLGVVATELAGLRNGVVVEGHTDATPFGRLDYTNWELSVDRANAARRILVGGGLSTDRLVEVRGYSDRRLKFADDPFDHRNRRVTLLLPFDTPASTEIDQALVETAARMLNQNAASGGNR